MLSEGDDESTSWTDVSHSPDFVIGEQVFQLFIVKYI